MINVFDFCYLIGDEKEFFQLGQILQTLDHSQPIVRNVENFKVNQCIQIFQFGDLVVVQLQFSQGFAKSEKETQFSELII